MAQGEEQKEDERDESPSWATADKAELDAWFYGRYRRLGYTDEQIQDLIKTILEDL
jgi:hypothetical protein